MPFQSWISNMYVKAALAGIFFGIWPLLMSRSGLAGNVASAVFSVIVLAGVLPFAFYSNGLAVPAANWNLALFAGICGFIGLLFFNGALAKVTRENVGSVFILTIIVQICIAAGYQTVINRNFPLDKACGYAAAIISAILLIR